MDPGPPSAFDDSGFDWEVAVPRSRQVERLNMTETDRLAWVVLVLLTLCPALGFLLALLASR